jgi:hypothetical protein
MKSQQEKMKSFIESECRSLGCEYLAAPLAAGFSACYESMRVPSKEEYLAAMKHLRTLSPEEIAERNANASRIVDEILAEDKKKREQDELRRKETRELRKSTMGNPLTVNEFKSVLEKYGYKPVMHGGLWYGADPARKNQFWGDYVFAELNGSMYDDGQCTARIRSTDGGAEYFDKAQFEEGVKKYFDARNAGDDPDDILCESIGDTVRGLFGKKKKPEDEEPQDEFFIRPYGGPIHQPNRYPGLIWSILGAINCDYDGKITKEQAIGYIKRLLPAIKENPDMPAFEKTLYRVVNAIE